MSERDPLEKLAESFLQRYRRGERPSLDQYIDRRPDLADRIRELFPALVDLEQLGSLPGSSTDTAAVPQSPRPLALVQLGDYRIVREVGRGGMGIVYEATRGILGCNFALKVLHPDYREDASYRRRFLTEARAAARLLHTNIVPVFDWGEQCGVLFYVMQYIPGQALDKVLTEIRRLRATPDPAPRPVVDLSLTATEASAGEERATAVARSMLTGRFTANSAPLEVVTQTFDDRPGGRPAPAHAPAEPSYGPLSGDSAAGDRADGPKILSDSLTGRTVTQYHRAVARVGVQVASALEHAHRKGILHRDIKPSNLLLDAQGNVWVTDFGLARFEEGGDASQTRDAGGTLRYMAPERFDGHSDRRSDVYALGATLYEMLTLQPAFEGRDQLRLIDRILHEPPKPPREIDRQIPRDLETIIMKALSKLPDDRFSTAEEMARELERFWEGKPIWSRPISPLERTWRWSKRNPAVASLIGMVAVLLVVIATGASVMAVRFKRDRDRVAHYASDAQEKLWGSYLAQARAGRWSRRPGQRFDSLRALTDAARIRTTADLRDEAIACMALPDIRTVAHIPVWASDLSAFVFDAALERYARSDSQGNVSIRQITGDREVLRLPGHGTHIFDLVFSPDGRTLFARYHLPHELWVWDLARCRPIWKGADTGCDFSPDGLEMAIGDADGTIHFCDTGSGKLKRQLHISAINSGLSFAPDGSKLAVRGRDGRISICETTTGRVEKEFATGGARSIYWHPDGRHLAIVCLDDRIRVWDTQGGHIVAVLEGEMTHPTQAQFSHDGRFVLSGGWDEVFRLWDWRMGKQLLTTLGSPLMYNRSSHDLAFVRAGRNLELLELENAPEVRRTNGGHGVGAVAFGLGGRLLATIESEGVRIWDSASLRELGLLHQHGCLQLQFNPADGSLLVCGGFGLLRWTISTDRDSPNLVRIGPAEAWGTDSDVWDVSAGSAGSVLTYADRARGRAVVVDSRGETKAVISNIPNIAHIALSPDGKLVTTHTYTLDSMIKETSVWDVATGQLIKTLPSSSNVTTRFSPDGRWLMIASNQVFQLWSTGSWKAGPFFSIKRQSNLAGRFAFAPDGTMLALAVDAGEILLVDPRDGRPLASLGLPELERINALGFKPDGTELAATFGDKSVAVWDLRLIRNQLARIRLDWDAAPFADRPTLEMPPLAQLRLTDPYLAILRKLAARDDEAWQRAAKPLFQNAAHRLTPDQANDLVWTLSLLPKGVPNREQSVHLAQQALNATVAPQKHLVLNTLGAALYRAGEYKEAVARLEEAMKSPGGAGLFQNWAFLAMAQQKLGRRDQARQSLFQLLEAEPAKDAPERLRLEFEVLRRQVEALLSVDAQESPSDLVAPPGSP